MPSLALSSVVRFSTELPFTSMSPLSTWYSGLPIITFESVDFPTPFGPIITCVSFSFILKLNLFKTIFLLTETVKSFISMFIKNHQLYFSTNSFI